MTGTIVNAAAIVIGGIVGLTAKNQPSAGTQSFFKTMLGVFTVYFGLRMTWVSISGSFLQVLKQLLIVILAMMLGKIAGRLLHLQKTSNRLGQYARERIAHVRPNHARRWSEGFNICALLFCAAPLAVLGAVSDGLVGYFHPLVIKGVMDGLATMAFVSMFGWGVVLAALPVFVYQGTITLLCAQYLEPLLRDQGLIDSVNATNGLLIFCVALIIFELRRIELADYLPSLAFAPLIAWVLR